MTICRVGLPLHNSIKIHANIKKVYDLARVSPLFPSVSYLRAAPYNQRTMTIFAKEEQPRFNQSAVILLLLLFAQRLARFRFVRLVTQDQNQPFQFSLL
jgi:hypothetical protein